MFFPIVGPEEIFRLVGQHPVARVRVLFGFVEEPVIGLLLVLVEAPIFIFG